VPLRHQQQAVGVLKVYDQRTHAFAEADATTLGLLSGVIAAHMTHATEFQTRHRDSRHDFLTGLPNRRAFDEMLERELARLRRHGTGFVLCLVDLDRFKHVNDTSGHAAGDAVLRAVARHLGAIRTEDIAFRLGGDEFALLLIDDDASGAVSARARIATAIALDADCGGVGTSWGFAIGSREDTVASIFERADASLYAAKLPPLPLPLREHSS
jgi:diguanylate cyclase (GGDEF)-like protein